MLFMSSKLDSLKKQFYLVEVFCYWRLRKISVLFKLTDLDNKCLKMAQNDRQWPKKDRKWSKKTKNDRKRQKMIEKDRKMFEKDRKISKITLSSIARVKMSAAHLHNRITRSPEKSKKKIKFILNWKFQANI
jgi:hypothetical protein